MGALQRASAAAARTMISTQIAVVGAGLMGHGIAQIFLAAGHKVALYDPDERVLEGVRDKIADIFDLLGQDKSALENLNCYSDLPSTVRDADLVVEAAPENLQIKRDIFASLSENCKETAVLATNTSSIAVQKISGGLPHSNRIVGAHFWNPPHLVRLVEVVQSDQSDTAAIDFAMDLLQRAAMQPVHVKRDIPGLIGNRLQHAMKREAIALVESGVCDAETVDKVVKLGFGSRLGVLGPLEQSDLVGLNMTLAIHQQLMPELDRNPFPSELLQQKVRRGELGMKSGKGFREWTEESAQKVRDRLRDHLVEQAKLRLRERES